MSNIFLSCDFSVFTLIVGYIIFNSANIPELLSFTMLSLVLPYFILLPFLFYSFFTKNNCFYIITDIF